MNGKFFEEIQDQRIENMEMMAWRKQQYADQRPQKTKWVLSPSPSTKKEKRKKRVLRDKFFTCKDCGEVFVYTALEQGYARRAQLAAPEICLNCRYKQSFGKSRCA